jgi:hypothetical protein
VADGVVRDADGPLAFVPDPLLGDDPEAVKRGLEEAYRRLCELTVTVLPWLRMPPVSDAMLPLIVLLVTFTVPPCKF